MGSVDRKSIRELAARYIENGQPLSWFDLTYKFYGEDRISVPSVRRFLALYEKTPVSAEQHNA